MRRQPRRPGIALVLALIGAGMWPAALAYVAISRTRADTAKLSVHAAPTAV